MTMRPVAIAAIGAAILSTLGVLTASGSSGMHPDRLSGPLGPARDEPQFITLAPVKDNTLYESATGDVSNGKGAHIFAGNSNAGVIHRAVLAFDIAGSLPANAEVDGAVLSLRMSRTSSGPLEIQLHRLTSAWGEGASNADDNEGSGAPAASGDATWLHTFHPDELWSTPGGDFASEPSARTTVDQVGRYEWSSERMEDELEAWLADPASNHGWILVGQERGNDGAKLRRTSKRFDSVDNPDADARPQLTIEYRVDDGSSTPETRTPETETPETRTPETSTPETRTPETSTPETRTPETETPETSTPETRTPETATTPAPRWTAYLPVAWGGAGQAPPATATATATAVAQGPGVPDCRDTTGDAGGFRFSLDGGQTLAPNDSRLANVAYTWDLEVDPRDPDTILQLHQGRLFRSTNAGCGFIELTGLPDGPWDRLVVAPSMPDLLVVASVFASQLAYSENGGETWTVQDLPDDVMDLAIAPDDPWHWRFVGRGPTLYERRDPAEKWSVHDIPLEAGQSVIAAGYASSDPRRWLVASATEGLYSTDDGGASWTPASDGLFEPIDGGDAPTQSVVVSSVAFAPSDPQVAYAALNQVGRDESLRGIWRSADGGTSWSRVVRSGDRVADRTAYVTGGTRVFVSPHDADRVFFAYGMAYDAYGTDLFRSTDGLRSLEVSHFDGFYKVYSMAFGPPDTRVVFVGASSDVPSAD